MQFSNRPSKDSNFLVNLYFTVWLPSSEKVKPLENENKLGSHKSLNKFGRKKSVSFSRNIDIVNVDSYKSFNVDVSITGCLEWDRKKIEERKKKEEEEKRKREEKEEGCTCIIF